MPLPADFDPDKVDLSWPGWPDLGALDVPDGLTKDDLEKVAALVTRWERDEGEFTAIPLVLAVYRALAEGVARSQTT